MVESVHAWIACIMVNFYTCLNNNIPLIFEYIATCISMGSFDNGFVDAHKLIDFNFNNATCLLTRTSCQYFSGI